MTANFNKSIKTKKKPKVSREDNKITSHTTKHNIKIESVESFLKRGGEIEVIEVGKKGQKSSKS